MMELVKNKRALITFLLSSILFVFIVQYMSVYVVELSKNYSNAVIEYELVRLSIAFVVFAYFQVNVKFKSIVKLIFLMVLSFPSMMTLLFSYLILPFPDIFWTTRTVASNMIFIIFIYEIKNYFYEIKNRFSQK
ncbi:hypothetical protein F3D3_0459 [Fusibacter sp. 3D3]|nr:hypothetical protein F3D3_0459 [Fusibacter sp. 3D3]